MELRFWNDAETGLPHFHEHGVTEEEVLEIMSRPGEEFAGDDNSRIRLGQTQAGRYLQVVFVPDADRKGGFVVTAYDMADKAKRAFRRRRRRKQR